MTIHTDIAQVLAAPAFAQSTLLAADAIIAAQESAIAEYVAQVDDLQRQLEECQAQPPVPPPFVPGETAPFFDPITESGNIGAKGELTPYTGSLYKGIYKLSDGGFYENILFPSVVELTGGEHLRNCMIEVPYGYVQSDSIQACLRILNGATNTGAILEDVTIVNRAQRAMNGVMGRNTSIYRSVVLGCIDGFSDASTGDAPQNFGLKVYDSCVPEHAFWQAPSAPSEIHPSDPICHADGYQTGTTLPSGMVNCTVEMYVSDKIGTGTPGAASDDGNPYRPYSGSNYIATKAQMAEWRNANTKMTVASQSKYGISHRIMTKGSSACAMINRDNFLIDHSYFSGGIIPVNMLDSNLPTNMAVTIRDTKFWNDMNNGPGSRSTDPTVKGYAIIIKKGKSALVEGNVWFDDTVVNPVYS